MDPFSAIVLGLVQGLTEFLPISSTGHLILAREFLSVPDSQGLAVDAMLHLATAAAVAVYFWKDLLKLLYAFLYRITGRPVEKEDERMLILLIIATIPAVIAGLLLEEYMETVFRSTMLVAWMLILGSLIFLLAEWVGKRYREQENKPTIRGAIFIGLFQCLALIPGMSRSGMTISAGLFFGLTRESAARFAFLLALPIISGAGAKKFLELYQTGTLDMFGGPILLGAATAFLSGLAAIWFLLRFLKTNSLTIFVIYRIVLAMIVLLFFV